MAPAFEHDALVTFSYPSEPRARAIADALAPEVGEIDDDRSAASVERDGGTVSIRVEAADLVALRAGINSWTRLVATAEDLTTRGEKHLGNASG